MKLSEFVRLRPALVISLVLGMVTFGLYIPTLRHGFVDFDDQGYITDNPSVIRGLSWPGTVWAFHSFEQGNWHPLTWITHMIDCSLFGVNPAGHHLVNALIHTANTILVFYLLRRMTGKLWPSAFVAAFFGWHPLHVESVAWASERKDVLCAFFWLLTMLAYAGYAKNPRPGIYLLTLALFACALMSKPMAVTLPFVLLLMDYWPLNRWGTMSKTGTVNPDITQDPIHPCPANWWKCRHYLILEKTPFFILSLADAWATFVAQKKVGAMLSVSALPFSYRLENALWSYLRYVSDLLCPAGLSIIYPYKAQLPIGLVCISIALLIIWSGLFLLWRARFPYLLTGWFWFLGTLVPTIGLVQVGGQSMADRYMYLPSIGLFVLIVWAMDDLMRFYPRWQNGVRLAGAAALAGCLVLASIQIRYWQNTFTLFTHAIAVTGDNGMAYYSLGLAFEQSGDRPTALSLYQKSVSLAPDYYPAQYGLGSMLLAKGDYAGAETHLESAEKLDQHDPKLQFNLGMILLNAQKNAEGISHLQNASQLAPDNARYHAYFGFALQKVANIDKATEELSRALALQPDYSYARYGLAAVLTMAGRTNEALAQYQTEVNLHGEVPDAHYNLGVALLDDRHFAEAQAEFERELHLAPADIRGHYRLAQTFKAEGRFADSLAQYRIVLQTLPAFAEVKNEMTVLQAAHPELK